ncbi:hypothetical protein [Actinoplanes solisilvae]|uniref:hypothetical protein n=1 Tax=Actinoplanes solisilvae TaxID=2486853 RepID=UPI000FDC864B|nr:hypothetical protein [Actinoplanes solisilvae]
MINSPRLIRAVPKASWLPAGSTAEIWGGADIDAPEPAVIVRLLVQRDGPGGRELFCVSGARGPDLPTVFLGGPDGWRPAKEGVSALTRQYLGTDAPTRCVGFVRNIVPRADDSYRLPVPVAHVPVFTPHDPTLQPAEDTGEWIGELQAATLLRERHWWLIARDTLGWTDSPVRRWRRAGQDGG